MSDSGPSDGVRRAISRAAMEGPAGISEGEQNTILAAARREGGISPSEVDAARSALNRARANLLERLQNDPDIGPGMGSNASELTARALEGMANNSQFDWHAIHEFSRAAELIGSYETLVHTMEQAYENQSLYSRLQGDDADVRHGVGQFLRRNF